MSETLPGDHFEQWCVVEVLGHHTYAGLVTEQVLAGAAFIRVDVPETPAGESNRTENAVPAFTKLIAPASIYAITPCSEQIARAVAARSSSPALNVYVPELVPSPSTRRLLSGVLDDDEDRLESDSSEEIPQCECAYCQCAMPAPMGGMCDNCRSGCHQG